eukprot:1189229-Prorocentrum_minimum.AAC.1
MPVGDAAHRPVFVEHDGPQKVQGNCWTSNSQLALFIPASGRECRNICRGIRGVRCGQPQRFRLFVTGTLVLAHFMSPRASITNATRRKNSRKICGYKHVHRYDIKPDTIRSYRATKFRSSFQVRSCPSLFTALQHQHERKTKGFRCRFKR